MRASWPVSIPIPTAWRPLPEHWCRGPGVLWRRSLDAVLVLGPRGDGPLTLAGTATELWDLLAAPTTVEDLVSSLAARHDADPTVVAADLTPVLAELATLGVLEVASAPGD
jgi:hypothetical protein